jgi:hypothetical protein
MSVHPSSPIAALLLFFADLAQNLRKKAGATSRLRAFQKDVQCVKITQMREKSLTACFFRPDMGRRFSDFGGRKFVFARWQEDGSAGASPYHAPR